MDINHRINPYVKLFVVVGVAILAVWAGFQFYGSLSDPVVQERWRDPIVTVNPATPQTIYPQSYALPIQQAQAPQQIIVTPLEGVQGPPGADGVSRVILVDTVRIAVPAAIARDSGNVRITSQSPVRITRPIFGRPRVDVATYNPNTSQYETLRYRIKPHPVSYGVEVEGYVAAPLSTAGAIGVPSYGVAGRVYVGYLGLQPFVGLDASSNGLEARTGLRYRFGR